MNKRRQFTEEFKQEATNQVIERGYPIKEVAKHLGISDKTLYNRVNRFKTPQTQRSDQDALASENKRYRIPYHMHNTQLDIRKSRVDCIRKAL
ncbi:transposase [Candidatus Vondammii sp. HM_W22]